MLTFPVGKLIYVRTFFPGMGARGLPPVGPSGGKSMPDATTPEKTYEGLLYQILFMTF